MTALGQKSYRVCPERDGVTVPPIRQPLVVGCLALILVGALVAQRPLLPHPGNAPLAPLFPPARGVGNPAPSAAPPPGWQVFVYRGGAVPAGQGQAPTGIPGYSLAYPPRWTAHLWPDSFADAGQLDLRAPSGSAVGIVLIPSRPHGPTLADQIARDQAYLTRATRDRVALPLGTAVRLSGTSLQETAGVTIQILYLQRGAVVYRLFSTHVAGAPEPDALARVASTLHIPVPLSGPLSTPTPPLPYPPTREVCCHCPAWGAGWGVVLTSLDGVPVYSNAGNTDNGCVAAYGLSYQCVELVQRYFALRWGYPAIWSGVYGAADMRARHPAGIVFIPNGGSSGPREGDALVFNGGTFGHVALVRSVDRPRGRIEVVEQNWSAAGETTLPIYPDNTIGLRNSLPTTYAIVGWLHSPQNASSPPTAMPRAIDSGRTHSKPRTGHGGL